MKVRIQATIEVDIEVTVHAKDLERVRGSAEFEDETLAAVAAYQKAFGRLPDTHSVVDWQADIVSEGAKS